MPSGVPTPSRSAFEGIPRAGLRFLSGLARHNERAWFQAHHAIYREHLREPLLALAEQLNVRITRFAPEYVTPPRRAITAVNRDLRFARDRSKPYKSWLALAFRREDATLGNNASFYVSVSPREVRIRCGLPLPAPHAIRRLRAHVAEAYQELRTIQRRQGLRNAFGGLQGRQLRRIPKDVPADHPAGALLLYRSLFVEARLDAALAEGPGFVTEVARHFRVAAPLVTFLDDALVPREA